MIFIDNKYTRWYYGIIENARDRILSPESYSEEHHIIPDCFYANRKRKGPPGLLPGDPDAPENLVLLTAREHFVCHWLMTKMTEGIYKQKAVASCILMIDRCSGGFKSALAYQRIKGSTALASRGIKRPEIVPKLRRSVQKYYDDMTDEQRENKKISAKKGAQKRLRNGNHEWLTRPDGSSLQQDKVKNGTHKWLTRPDGSSQGRDNVLSGVCKFVGPDAPSQQEWTCEYCNKSGKGEGNYTKWHKNGKCLSTERPEHLIDQWTCPHCNTVGKGKANYSRWHGDNCRANPLSSHYNK